MLPLDIKKAYNQVKKISMCTVIYIPGKKQNIFVSLRDEDTSRPRALVPQLYKLNDRNYLAPKDSLAGGTWVGVNDLNHVIILLNGGFEKHVAGITYKYSRGLIVNALLGSNTPLTDWEDVELLNIEPFTLVVQLKHDLYQLVWDGIEKHVMALDSQMPYLWSSVTLYDKGAGENRKRLFQQWLQEQPVVTKESVFSFFLRKADPDNGFIINRAEKLKTLSYSFLTVLKSREAIFDYYDLLKGTNNTVSLNFAKESNSLFTVNETDRS